MQWPLPERGTAMSVDQKDAAIRRCQVGDRMHAAHRHADPRFR
jgi:hypothetical protein